MKAIMISIKPKYVAKILNGTKTLEIRKSYPKCDLPIDVYIYCTKGKGKAILEGTRIIDNGFKKELRIKENKLLNGKVVAKFTLNKVEEIEVINDNLSGYSDDYECGYQTESMCSYELYAKSCLKEEELDNYLKGKTGYAWHIDNLLIFDKPKELSEFSVRYPKGDIKFKGVKGKMLAYKPLTKPFQSWGYVEVEVK